MTAIADITHGADNLVLPFQIDNLDVRGRVLRMGSAFDAIAKRHAYPDAVTRLMGEVAALGLLISSALKFDGKLILQTQTDGPVRLLVADIQTPARMRALARFDKERLATILSDGGAGAAELLGQGQLVMTIDQGQNMQRYQGVVALEGQSLSQAADDYFRQSEQIPTRVKLEVGSEMVEGGAQNWRLGGMLIQHLPSLGGTKEAGARSTMPDAAQAEAQWTEARALFETVEPVELLDTTLAPERLLYRLFHEQGVRVFEPVAITEECNCSRKRIEDLIRSFSKEERAHMNEGGRIVVTCDYCSTRHDFDPAQFD